MPFTASHAAAVLPLVRRDGAGRGPLVASALVAGSFAPDVPYFAASAAGGLFVHGQATHTPWGTVLVDPLVAAALVGMWLALRGPVAALLPRRWAGRAYAVLRGRPLRGRPPAAAAAWFWFSAVLGAASHVLWDSFTHPGRWGVRLVPGLDAVVAGVPAYLVVQYGSSALALALLGTWCASAVRRAPARPLPPGAAPATAWGRAAARALVLGCTAAGAVHRCVRYTAVLGDGARTTDFVPTAMFGAGAGLVAGLLLLAAAARVRAARVRAGRALPPGARAGRREGPPAAGAADGQWAADSQSGPTPTETSSGARSG
ncbi:DUF4184 family protein [Streptomyces sp. NPDC059637]|uniref:DUF4184 family protein n=1 Tax=Streptomyces sp. NPDC059637 TaxID=3347752 RepID=UPI003684A7A3